MTLLLGILALGLLLRLLAISNFHFYTDSYNYMLMAQFFTQTGQMHGPMGSTGDLFVPSPSPIYKWGYPLLLSIPIRLDMDPESAGRSLGILLGCSTIPLAYYFSKKLHGNIRHATWAALLMGFSYENVTWGGFVLTDIPALFWVLCSCCMVVGLHGWLSAIFSGFFLAMAGLTRTELSLLIIPIALFLCFREKKPLGTIFLFLLVFLSVFLFVIFHFGDQIPIQESQGEKEISSMFVKVLGRFLHLERLDVRHVFTFMMAEAALCWTAFIGCVLWFKEGEKGKLLLLGSYLCPLILLYNVSLNEHHRYYTQLLPALVIPSSYALGAGFDSKRVANRLWRWIMISLPWVAALGIFLQCVQVVSKGHRSMDYPQESARWVKRLLDDGKIKRYEKIFGVQERALYFYTEMECRKLSGQFPYMNVEGITGGETVLLLVDEIQVRPSMPGFMEAIEEDPRSFLVDRRESEALLLPVYGRHPGQERTVYLWRVPGDLLWSLAQGHWKVERG